MDHSRRVFEGQPDCFDDVVDNKPARPDLLSVDEAIAIARSYTSAVSRPETILVLNSAGRVLALPIAAIFDMPPFDQSAMDGYALGGEAPDRGYEVLTERSGTAGYEQDPIANGQATSIATGAPVPLGADRVVMFEHAKKDGLRLFAPTTIGAGANIRRCGEDVKRGSLLLDAFTRMDPQKIALLSAQGIAEVTVLSRPRIAVVSSGNELCDAGQDLAAGQIFDSNRPMLLALVAEAGADAIDGGIVRDNISSLAATLKRLAERCDIVILSGGSSVGEGDLTYSALLEGGAVVERLKIGMKPGKPALVGKLGNASILGLPGNPVAAFASWYTLGGAMLAQMLGIDQVRDAPSHVPAAAGLRRRSGRTEFVPALRRADAKGDVVELLGPGGSGRLLPLSRANGFVVIEPDRCDIAAGDLLEFRSFR